MKKNYKELLSNTAVFAISNLLSKILLMLLLPIYTGELTTEQYGVVELATNISLLIIPFVSLAIQDAVFRYTVDKSLNRNTVFKNAFWILVLGTSILLIISSFLFLYDPLCDWRWWFWGFASLNMIRSTLCLYAKGTDKTKVFAIDSILYNGFLAVNNIVFLVFLGYKIEGYFLSIIISQVISIGYILYNVEKPNLKEIFTFPLDNDSIIKMLRYSTPLVLNSISWNLAHTTDRLMLDSMRNTSDVGIYSAASKIPSLISTVMNIFVQAWTISAIRNFTDKEAEKFYEKVFQFVQVLLVIVTLGIMMVNNRILVILLGDDFKIAIKYTPILMMATSVLFYSNFIGPVFSSVQKSKSLMYTTLIGTIFNVILNYYLICNIGILGACIATFISNTIVSVLRMILARKIFYFYVDWFRFLIGWLFIICACIATMNFENYSELIILGLIFCYLVINKKNLKDLVNQIMKSVRGKKI